MKNTNTYTQEEALERAFVMYKETVSPPPSVLVNVLNHIPEKKKITAEKRQAIRSPYIWLRVTQFASVFVILFALIATLPIDNGTFATEPESNNPFSAVDAQIASFEKQTYEEDTQKILSDYML